MPSARTCAPRCALKLGQMLHTLPDRLVLARQQNMTHADFLELVLADEHARREAKSASLRARAAGLETGMRLDTWDNTAAVRYDQQLWNELASLRFLDAPHGALLLGPVGVGKTHLACALGHIAIRRRRGVHMARADKLFKRLKAARLDNTLDYEMRRLATTRSEEHTSELQSQFHLVCRLLLEKKKKKKNNTTTQKKINRKNIKNRYNKSRLTDRNLLTKSNIHTNTLNLNYKNTSQKSYLRHYV